jgi:hypothetical protein
MEYITIGIVLVPLLLSFIASVFNQNKAGGIFIQIFAFLFFLSALIIFLYPLDSPTIPIPSVIWKLLTLSVTVAFSIRAVFGKRYGLSFFLFVQSAVLIVTEITVSLNEPAPFLFYNHSEKLILLFGAFIIASLIPLLARYMSKNTIQPAQKKQTLMASFMLMSAFAGLIAAKSLTGLFLFWQLCYGANHLFVKACGKHEDIKYRRISLIRQIALTIWLSVNGAIFFSEGYTKISDINMAAGNMSGLLCAISLITAIIMGLLLPEENVLDVFLGKRVPYMGFSAVILSLMSQFAVLQKLEPLFSSLNHSMISLVIVLGALLMAAAAYYASTAQKVAEIPACMVLYVFGWGLASAFTGAENQIFTTGYTIVSAITVAFLFCLVMAKDYSDMDTGLKRLKCNYPFISNLMIIGMISFLFVPFYTGLNRIVFIDFLTDYPVSMLIVIASFAVFTAATFKWVIAIMTSGKKGITEKRSFPVSFKIAVAILFLASLGTNLLSGRIYRYFLLEINFSGYLPAKDLEEYTRLDGGIYLFRFGTGFIYLFLTITILSILFIAFKFPAKSRAKTEDSAAAPYRYSLTSWLPGSKNFENLFQAGFVVIVLLLVGVSLSCLI